MRRLGWIDGAFSEEAKNPDNWIPVYVDNLSDSKKERFKRRKLGIELYLKSELSLQEVLEKSGISHTELIRIINRAFTVSADGLPYGYAACIPGFHIKKYERTASSSKGKAGKFTQFINAYPKLKKKLDDWALGRVKIDQSKVRGKLFKRIWKVFKDECEKNEIDIINSYPFSNRDMGREAIRQYCKKLRKKNFIRGAIVEYGNAAGAHAAHASSKRSQTLPKRPYEKVQLDGHRLDTCLILKIRDAAGDELLLPLSRVWLIVLICIQSRAVLGYSLSLSFNYTLEDLLDCIAMAYTPWFPKDIPTERIQYNQNAGLPSGIIDECKWRAFDILQMDNHYAHLSEEGQKRIIESGVLEVITNRPYRPRSDAVVERFMETFEEETFHEWPSTTGSNPKDPRRNNPDEAAKRLEIEFDDLVLITDIAIANYNATPHTSLNSRTPLEYIQYHIDKENDLLRYVQSQDPKNFPLYDSYFSVTIRGNRATGHLPYIKFKNVRYTNECLEKSPELIDSKATFKVNRKDIRSGLLFLESGTCVGRLHAEARWLSHPHSLKIRNEINKLVHQKKLQSDSDCPISNYLNYLAERTKLGRKERNQLLKTQRETRFKNKPEPMPKKTATRQHFENKFDNRITLSKIYSK